MSDNKMHLDYSRRSLNDRLRHVNDIIDHDSVRPSERRRLNAMADYLMSADNLGTTKTERRHEYPIVTRNRNATIDKRQTSLESMMSSLESSPVSIYEFINSDRDLFLEVKDTISQDAIDANPELRALYGVIESLQAQLESATGKNKYSLKKQIIETWQQVYLVRANNNPARVLSHALDMKKMDLSEHVQFDEDGLPYSDAIVSFYNPTHISFLLEYYLPLKHECGDDMNCDMRWLLMDVENLVRDTFKDSPKKLRLCLMKMLGYTNEEINDAFLKYYGKSHTKQYYSMIWRNTIPREIVQNAQKRYVEWYWRNPDNKMTWKKCPRCKRWLPAHPLFFRRNASSKDGLYSVCTECSRKKSKAVTQ